jgi:AcrR family transcriptional regulator
MAYRRTAEMQARLDATRDRIVDATVGRVASGGWGAVSVAAVARDAGVATGTVYRHLEDKDVLLVAAFRRAAGRELQVVTEAVKGPGPPAHRLEAAVRVFAERALRGRRLAYALLAEPAGPAIEAERLAHRAGYRAVFRTVLEDGIADGSIVDHDSEVVAAALVGAIGEALVGRASDVVVDGGDRLDALVATCLRAVPFTDPGAGATSSASDTATHDVTIPA